VPSSGAQNRSGGAEESQEATVTRKQLALLAGNVVLVLAALFGFSHSCAYVSPEDQERWQRQHRIDDMKKQIEERETRRRLDELTPER
jgi:hypothetical protein